MTFCSELRALCSAALLLVAGCSTGTLHIPWLQPSPGERINVPAYRLPPQSPGLGHTIAGVGKTDITPPPGFPTGGHGPAGAMARGYWTRLYARALFFQDATGSPLILVSCDFFAVPGGLSALVSQRIADKWGNVGLSIPPDAIIISATHTHQGPGNYMTSGSYNQYGSKYPGFDERLFNFLVDRVTDAIDSAIVDARNNGAATLSLYSDSLSSDLLMNRSPVTFLNNWNAARTMDRLNPRMPPCRPVFEQGEAKEKASWDLRGCPRLRSIDRTATILEIKRGGSRVGLAVFLAAHPTVLDHHAEFFSSDWTGTAVSTLERQAESAPGHRIVVAFFNGAEGDVVARRGDRDLLDVTRLRDSLVKSIDRILDTTRPRVMTSPKILARQGFLWPDSVYATGPESTARMPRHPEMGTAGLGGPEEDRTALYQLGWDAGHHEIPRNGQGGKLGALDSQILPLRLTHLLAPDYTFPRRLPVSWAELGDLRIAALPVEMSTASGLILRDLLRARGRLEIIGLANEYSSYVATPDEYAVQDYMGASTLWGPNEAPILAWSINCLATPDDKCSPLTRRDPFYVDAAHFSPGATPAKMGHRKNFFFGPAAVGERLNEVDDELDVVLKDRTGAPERNLPRFEWTETIRSRSEEFAAASAREVRILQRAQGQWFQRTIPGTSIVDDDSGFNFLTLLREAPRSGSREQRRWSAIWLAPILEESTPRGEYRFEVVIKRNGQVVLTCESLPFAVDLSPAQRTSTIKPDGNCT